MTTTHSPEGVDAVALFQAIDRFDAEAFGAFFAADATYVFSNYPATHGREAIVGAAVAFWETVETLEHKLHQLIPFPGGFVSRLEITFGMTSRQTVTLPAAMITRTADRLITEHRIYLNESPLNDDQREPAHSSDAGA